MGVMMDLTMMSQREAPRRLRSATLRHVCEALSASAGMFFSVDKREQGLHFGHVLAIGSVIFTTQVGLMAGHPLMAGAMGPLGEDGALPSYSTPAFLSLAQEWGERPLAQPWADFLSMHRFTRQRRLVVYDNEDNMVGVLIAFKKEQSARFDEDLARELVADTRDAIVLADMFERPDVPQQEMYAMYSEEGELTLASWEAPQWLDAKRSKQCSELACQLVASGERRATTAFDGIHVELERMSGGRPCVLAIFTPQTPARRQPAKGLNVREQRIAEFLAVGATTEEIARHFEGSAVDVHTEVERIYQHLGVTNRGGLVVALRAQKLC